MGFFKSFCFICFFINFSFSYASASCDHCTSLKASDSCEKECEPCAGCVCEKYGVYSGGNCSCGAETEGDATWNKVWNGSGCVTY
jgi:hypothetical protein